MELLLSLHDPRHLQPPGGRLVRGGRGKRNLFKPLFDDAIVKHNVPPGQFTLHPDRGGPMKAKATALLLADLGVTRSSARKSSAVAMVSSNVGE